jgi:Flp pilus assembly CpaF family ATPase
LNLKRQNAIAWKERISMDANALDNELLKLSLSPIAPWVDDPEVTDILVYGSRNVYVRRRGGGFEGVADRWNKLHRALEIGGCGF